MMFLIWIWFSISKILLNLTVLPRWTLCDGKWHQIRAKQYQSGSRNITSFTDLKLSSGWCWVVQSVVYKFENNYVLLTPSDIYLLFHGSICIELFSVCLLVTIVDGVFCLSNICDVFIFFVKWSSMCLFKIWSFTHEEKWTILLFAILLFKMIKMMQAVWIEIQMALKLFSYIFCYMKNEFHPFQTKFIYIRWNSTMWDDVKISFFCLWNRF
jgi:hypothetical protein